MLDESPTISEGQRLRPPPAHLRCPPELHLPPPLHLRRGDARTRPSQGLRSFLPPKDKAGCGGGTAWVCDLEDPNSARSGAAALHTGLRGLPGGAERVALDLPPAAPHALPPSPLLPCWPLGPCTGSEFLEFTNISLSSVASEW